MCKKPFMIGSLPCACQRCTPCLINRRRVWTQRMILESYCHEQSTFATLTYDERSLPKDGSLKPSDTQGFFKRLRSIIAPRKIRYFLAGEYGPQTYRPHYHIALYGFPNCLRMRTELRLNECCPPCSIIRSAWGHGGVVLGTLTDTSAAYVAGYLLKKIKKEDPNLVGKTPQFSRMSLRPGIGAPALSQLKSMLSTDVGLNSIATNLDVPTSLRHGSKLLPIGRYLRGKLREELWSTGIQENEYVSYCRKPPQEAIKSYVKKLQELRRENVAIAKLSSENPEKLVLDMRNQKLLNIEAKFKIHGGINETL